MNQKLVLISEGKINVGISCQIQNKSRYLLQLKTMAE